MKYSIRACDLEVHQFITNSAAYTIHAEGLRLDVARCQNLQRDEAQAFMWLKAVQGYFVLEQSPLGRRPGHWRIILEITPEETSSSFFPWFEDHFWSELSDWLVAPRTHEEEQGS